MPVTCQQIGGKWRLVDTTGSIEMSDNGNPRDGGGHESREQCMAQARAINASLNPRYAGDVQEE